MFFFLQNLDFGIPSNGVACFLVLAGPEIDKKIDKNQDPKKHFEKITKNTKIHDFGVKLSGRYAVIMPSKIALISFFFDHGPFWRARTPQDAEMTPKSLQNQNDPQSHKNNIKLLKIDTQK